MHVKDKAHEIIMEIMSKILKKVIINLWGPKLRYFSCFNYKPYHYNS